MKLSKVQKFLMVLALGLLSLAFLFPLWVIEIWAPQYPEGLSMSIGLSEITGSLDQINILNHYIGMAKITPSAIPELVLMPKLLGLLIGLGLLTLLFNRIWGVFAWFLSFSCLGLLGLYDFWKWGYDYGHNLNPDAPIKVEGMTYQPPLIGHKQILNIDAYSYPDIGAIAISLAAVAVITILVMQFKDRRKNLKLSVAWAAGLLIFGSMMGCTAKPQSIHVGVDSCDHCRMNITDEKYAAEVLTKKGRVFKFDSVPCLKSFVSRNGSQVDRILVADFLNHGVLVDVSQVEFLSSSKLAGPMGSSLVASSNRKGLEELRHKLSGEILNWDKISNSSKF
jgi:copper chaperone NosL